MSPPHMMCQLESNFKSIYVNISVTVIFGLFYRNMAAGQLFKISEINDAKPRHMECGKFCI